MGLNTMAIVADSVLSDEQLAELGIAPAGAAMTAEDALLRSQPEHVCVVRAATYTAVAGYADALAAAVESDRLALPGTVVAVSSVSSVDFVDFRVFVDGGLRRHLCTGDDGSANVGQPLPEESRFVFEAQDEELEVEVDGDILIDQVLAIAGVDSESSLLDARGDAFAPISAPGDVGQSAGSTGSAGRQKSRRWFRRG